MPKYYEWDDLVIVYAFLAGWRQQARPYRFVGMCEKSWSEHIANGKPLDRAYELGKQMADAVEVVDPDNHQLDLDHRDYVYGKLPTKLQKYWDKLERLGSGTDADIDRFIKDHGEGFRKAVFIKVAAEAFDVSAAMQRAGISAVVLKKWLRDDKNFRGIYDEVLFHKGNMIEQALMERIQSGDTQAIIFASKTLNKDRGYGEVARVEHTHTHEVNHTTVNLMDLGLEPSMLNAIVKAITDKQKADQMEEELKVIQGRIADNGTR